MGTVPDEVQDDELEPKIGSAEPEERPGSSGESVTVTTVGGIAVGMTGPGMVAMTVTCPAVKVVHVEDEVSRSASNMRGTTAAVVTQAMPARAPSDAWIRILGVVCDKPRGVNQLDLTAKEVPIVEADGEAGVKPIDATIQATDKKKRMDWDVSTPKMAGGEETRSRGAG